MPATTEPPPRRTRQPMSKLQEVDRPHATRARLSGIPAPSGNRAAFSGLVHRALLSFGERDHPRRRLLNILLLIQALLLLASTPAYLGGLPTVPSLVVVGCGLLIYLAAWVCNQMFQDVVRATYLLVAGGGVVVVAQVFLAAVLARDAVSASFAALLLLTIILEAGLLFSPDMTGLVSSIAVALVAVGLVLAVTLGPASSQQQTYVIIATVLSLQVATALIAWLLSRFIADTAVEAERAHALQIAQVRLDGLTTQAAEQRRRLEAGIAALRETIARALAGETQARALPQDADLAALIAPINQLLDRLDILGQPDMARGRMLAASQPLGELGGTAASAEPIQADLARRLLRIQEVAGEIVGGLTHSENGLASMSQTAAESLRTVGAAIATADGTLTAAQKGSELAQRARRLVSSLLPEDGAGPATDEAHAESHDPLDAAQAAALLGLGADLGVAGPGMTVEFSRLSQPESEDAHHPSAALAAISRDPVISAPLPDEGASEAEVAPSAAPVKRRKGARTLTAEAMQQIAELSNLLGQLQDEVTRQERGATALTHELGVATRHARGVDVGVAWTRQALEAIRRNAERLYQTAGGTAPRFPGGNGGAFAAGPPADLPPRAPQPTRPLTQSGKLPTPPEPAETPELPERETPSAATTARAGDHGEPSASDGVEEAAATTPAPAAEAHPTADQAEDAAAGGNVGDPAS